MAMILSGKGPAQEIWETVEELSQFNAAAGFCPGGNSLHILRVGQREDDIVYEKSIMDKGAKHGVRIYGRQIPEDVTTDEMLQIMDELNTDSKVAGVLMMRPLPKHLDEPLICNALDPRKDVDGITDASLGAIFKGEQLGYPPATAKACERMLIHYDIPVEGKHVVVVGRSLVIGKPIGMMLLNKNATVTFCHSRTADLKAITRTADIVICAIGKPKFFDASYFSEGQTVLDVGINFDEDGKLCGDVDFESVEPVVGAITPVPGGIGMLTSSIICWNTMRAADRDPLSDHDRYIMEG